jgi:YD repeat-containing protein
VIDRYDCIIGLGYVKTIEDVYSYDKDSRLTGLTHYMKNNFANDAVYTWTYDRASRPTAFTSSLDGSGGYTYDTTSQLTGETYSYQTNESHSYDANGNRTNTGYDTDANNRLASDGEYDYEYDDEGNRTRRTRISDGSYTDYTWDYRNRLTSVTDRTSEGVATKAVNYTYDVHNRLVGEILDPDGAGEEGTSEEYYAYDGDQILLRFDGPTTNDLVDRYLWAPTVDLLLSDEKLTGPSTPGDIYWALGDNLNTVSPASLGTGMCGRLG